MKNYRFMSISKLNIALLKTHFRGSGKTLLNDYITNLIYLKCRYLKYRLFLFLLPSFSKYVCNCWFVSVPIDKFL